MVVVSLPCIELSDVMDEYGLKSSAAVVRTHVQPNGRVCVHRYQR